MPARSHGISFRAIVTRGRLAALARAAGGGHSHAVKPTLRSAVTETHPARVARSRHARFEWLASPAWRSAARPIVFRRLLAERPRGDFQIAHHSVQHDHIHLIGEAASEGALASAMRSFGHPVREAPRGAPRPSKREGLGPPLPSSRSEHAGGGEEHAPPCPSEREGARRGSARGELRRSVLVGGLVRRVERSRCARSDRRRLLETSATTNGARRSAHGVVLAPTTHEACPLRHASGELRGARRHSPSSSPASPAPRLQEDAGAPARAARRRRRARLRAKGAKTRARGAQALRA